MGKRFTSVLILCLMLAHLAGFYVYFVVRLGEVRMEMRRKLVDLPASQLDVIVIPKESFRSDWLDELEMKWQGNMYDIARVESHGNDIFVYCLHDEDEDNLLSFLSAVVESAHQDTQEAPDSIVQFFTLEFIFNQPQFQIPLVTTSKPVTPFDAVLTSLFIDPLSPPPRI